MRIGFDIDDTISDTYNVIFNMAQKYTVEDLGKTANISSTMDAYTHMYFSSVHSWNQEEEKAFLDKYYKECIKSVKPRLYAPEIIERLKNEGNDIYLITARFKSEYFDIEKETIEWLKVNNIKYDKLFLNADNKVNLAKDNKLDIFVDDSFKNCKQIADAGIKTYIFNTIINRELIDNNLDRVYSWPHLYQEIQKIADDRRNA